MSPDKYGTNAFGNQTMQIFIEEVSTIWINVLKPIRMDDDLFNTAALFLQDFKELEGGAAIEISGNLRCSIAFSRRTDTLKFLAMNPSLLPTGMENYQVVDFIFWSKDKQSSLHEQVSSWQDSTLEVP